MDALSGDLETSFAELAVEQWRIIRVFGRLIDLLPADRRERVSAQMRFAHSRLGSLMQQANFRLESFDGRVFDPSLPVSPINADEFPPGSVLRVAETIEPTVLRDGRIMQLGRVALELEPANVPRD